LAEIYVLGGTAFASDGTSYFPDVEVTCRNITRGLKKTMFSDPSDGSYAFELFSFGGAATGDKVEIVGRIGPFYSRATHTVALASMPEDINLTLALESKSQIINLPRLNQEFVTFLRKNVVDPNSRGTVKQESQTGDGVKVKFDLAETNIKVINSITIDGAVKKEWEDYWANFKDMSSLNNPSIYFITPPSDEAMIDFTYTYGSTSWIYSDTPQTGIKLSSYPRVVVSTPLLTAEGELGGNYNTTSINGIITIFSEQTNEAVDLASKIRRLFLENKKKFHHFNFITPTITTPPIPVVTRGERIIQLSQGFRVPFKGEIIQN